jgi:hypothetical protein
MRENLGKVSLESVKESGLFFFSMFKVETLLNISFENKERKIDTYTLSLQTTEKPLNS